MKEKVRFLLLSYFAWFPLFMVQKPWFMLYNRSLADGYSSTDVWNVVLHGLKLDATVAGYLTIIPLLLTLVSTWVVGAWYKKVLKAYWLVAMLIVALICVVDMALYSFWGFRLDSTLFFYLQSPKDAMASVPIRLLIQQVASFLLYSFIGWFYWKKLLSYTPIAAVKSKIGTSCAILLLGGVMFIPIRGGVTTSTANVGMVYFSQKQFLNHSAINPCFSLLASLSKQEDFAHQFDFLPEEQRQQTIDSLLAPVIVPDSSRIELLTTKTPNILIIIMEGITANAVEAVGGEANITPCLNRIGHEGILFTNVYANSFRTDRGLVAVLNGYLAQPTTSIMKYPAKSQTLPSIAHSLATKGYRSDMLYGGDINFTNMQSYFFSSGYSRITSDKDFPIGDRLSKWGANDDVTCTWLLHELEGRAEEMTPWMTTFLTLSSHEPFEVPYHRLSHPYLNSVAFTDSCLGHFIDQLKMSPVWKNLLVVMVSDHGFRYPDGLKDYEPRRYHIPMIWTGGAVKEPKVIDTICNQTDLAATLLGQLAIPHDDFFFSKEIMAPHRCDYAFYTFSNGFGFTDSIGHFTVFDNESQRILFDDENGDGTDRMRKGQALLQTLYDDLGSR